MTWFQNEYYVNHFVVYVGLDERKPDFFLHANKKSAGQSVHLFTLCKI